VLGNYWQVDSLRFILKLEKKQFNNIKTSELAGFLGIILIWYSVVYFDSNIPFPSQYTIVPVFGAVLFIIFSTSQTIIGKLLGSKLLVGIGIISYSTYLYHQPLFAFTKQLVTEEKHLQSKVMPIIATLFCGYLSWRNIETPFRNNVNFERKKLYLIAFIAIFIFIIIV
jgi:peptidoglycan/LPS O-acetylase OafA/YrhL